MVGLTRLLDAGVRVRYIVTPSNKTLKFPTHPLLQVRRWNGPDDGMRVFHFVVGNELKMMWLERNHPHDSFTATDCEWVPPELADVDDRWGELSTIFEAAWERAIPI
jgi:hypothetical protein